MRNDPTSALNKIGDLNGVYIFISLYMYKAKSFSRKLINYF